MESLRGFSNLSSVEAIGESGSSSSNSVNRSGVVGIHMVKNPDLCRAQRIRCAAVATTERRTVPAGSRSNDDQSLFNVMDRMRDSGSGRGPCGSVFDFGSKVVDKDEDVSSKLDQWVKESVHEILNSLEEAPFLMQIYTDGQEEGGIASTKSSSRLVKVKAGPNSWPLFRDRWNGGESNTPNGVILVGEIDTEVNCGGDIGVLKRLSLSSSSSFRRSSQSTRVWGILIQGRGGSYPACYILKTSRVKGLAGVCTHFCLARVECFVEHVDILFKKLWLL